MHPPSAARFLDFQMPVARDFADVLGNVANSDGIVPNLYEKLFQYTMECKRFKEIFCLQTLPISEVKQYISRTLTE